jgi:hypothetical protein
MTHASEDDCNARGEPVSPQALFLSLRFSFFKKAHMQACDLVELAAVVAVNGRQFIHHGRISESALEQYWSISKSRLSGWSSALKDYGSLQQSDVPYVSQEASLILAWRCIKPIIEEILVSEILTRVWTALACEYDRTRASQEVEPVVRSIYLGHQEVRNQSLNLLVYGRGFNTQQAVEVNRLRRRCERWCDMLLAYVCTTDQRPEFSFEPERTAEFAKDLSEERSHSLNSVGWQIVLSSLRAAFSVESGESSHAEHHRKISAAILGCLGSDAFDSLGLMRTLWIDRIQHITDDAEGMLTQLMSLENDLPRTTVHSMSLATPRFKRT